MTQPLNTLAGLAALASVTLLASACGSQQNGQLVGVADRPEWKGINPYGMVYVPSGTLHIGASDADVSGTFLNTPKAISISGFYMDETEITNNEYRQFVQWVKDSIALTYLDYTYEDEYTGELFLDWESVDDIDWEDETLQDLFYQGDDRFAGRTEFDTRKLQYTYEWYDWGRAAHDKTGAPRNSFIERKTVNVYPDTLVWIRDFAYSYNEPMTRNYFSHPAFDDYPVVGVNWHGAKAFAFWRTNLWNSYQDENGVNSEDFRLPYEHEWEYAARGGKDLAPFPWGGYYVRNGKGCLLANFKPGRGNYPEDGGQYTVKADAYYPNDYGLYNMAGNVAEWTSTAYYANAYSFLHDLNPDIRYDAQDEDPESYKRKVIRGGSWKDISYFMQTGTRDWEYQDTTKSYVGFRCALSFLGRSINDF